MHSNSGNILIASAVVFCGFLLNQKIKRLEKEIKKIESTPSSGGTGSIIITNPSSLANTLLVGNNAGASNIDMNQQKIENVSELTFSNSSSLPPNDDIRFVFNRDTSTPNLSIQRGDGLNQAIENIRNTTLRFTVNSVPQNTIVPEQVNGIEIVPSPNDTSFNKIVSVVDPVINAASGLELIHDTSSLKIFPNNNIDASACFEFTGNNQISSSADPFNNQFWNVIINSTGYRIPLYPFTPP